MSRDGTAAGGGPRLLRTSRHLVGGSLGETGAGVGPGRVGLGDEPGATGPFELLETLKGWRGQRRQPEDPPTRGDRRAAEAAQRRHSASAWTRAAAAAAASGRGKPTRPRRGLGCV